MTLRVPFKNKLQLILIMFVLEINKCVESHFEVMSDLFFSPGGLWIIFSCVQQIDQK